MKNLILTFSLFALTISLSGCFEEVKSNSSTSQSSSAASSDIKPQDFAGAAAAKNKVTGIEVSWISSSKEVSAYKVYRVQGKKLNLLASLPSTVSAYVDGTVSWGSIYSYIVRAADTKGVEETNSKQVSALAWAGIDTVSPLTRSSLQINMANATPIADEVRIYLQPANKSVDPILVKTLTGSDLTATIENLKVGYKYLIKAQAYVNSLKKEDGNEVEFTVNTDTEGYHDEGISKAKWGNVMNIRAFGESPGSNPHPSILDKSPSLRHVEVAFNSFTSMPSTTKYVVIRTKEGLSIDTSASSACSDTTLTSCLACSFTGIGVLNCKDDNVAASPMRYRYTLALVHDDGTETWVEPLNDSKVDNFSVLVPIPPKDMILVQRDAVNYEMCSQMQKTSDPSNHNRCIYNGVGAVPYSSGHNKPPLNLTSGYYDFGYNLFVDRYPNACNWTRSANGGMCGAGATAGDCRGALANETVLPSNTIGVDGNVYWAYTHASWNVNYSSNICLQKIGGAWKRIMDINNSYTNQASYYQKMITTDPSNQGGQKPPLIQSNLGPITANLICNSFVDPNYGIKRISRMREYRAYAVFPIITNEPYATTYSIARNNWMGFSGGANQGLHDSSNGYACPNYVKDPAMTAFANDTAMMAQNDFAQYVSAGSVYGGGFFIGSPMTSDCQSRYGMHDMHFQQAWPVSDYFNYQQSPNISIGGISPIDDGNRDLLMDANGAMTGFKMDWTTAFINGGGGMYFYGTSAPTNYMSIPMGLPIFLSSSLDYLARAFFLQPYASAYVGGPSTASAKEPKQSRVNNRFEIVTDEVWNSNAGNFLLNRCVLPAE